MHRPPSAPRDHPRRSEAGDENEVWTMAGRHSLTARRRERDLEVVAVDGWVTHRVTRQARNAGRRAGGTYVAICGVTVLPVPAVVPGSGRYCRDCVTAGIPAQRGGTR